MTEGIGFFVERYGGWVGLGLYFLVEKAWPFFRDQIWPDSCKARAEHQERYRRLEERQLSINERQVSAIENMNQAVQAMTVAITTNNERLSQLIADHTQHAATVTQAIADMRVAVAKRGRRDS